MIFKECGMSRQKEKKIKKKGEKSPNQCRRYKQLSKDTSIPIKKKTHESAFM